MADSAVVNSTALPVMLALRDACYLDGAGVSEGKRGGCCP